MAVGGKNSDWRHGTNGAVGVLTDFTTKTRGASLDAEAETVDATVFGNGFRAFEQSFKNATISSTYKYDPTVYSQITAIFTNGDTVDFQLSPDGVVNGRPEITGEMFISSLGFPVEVGELLEFEVEWQVTGPVAFDIHS